MRFLDRSFLKFDDRSERKTKKSIYAKEFPMEEEKSEVKPKKKEGQDKIFLIFPRLVLRTFPKGKLSKVQILQRYHGHNLKGSEFSNFYEKLHNVPEFRNCEIK